MDGSPHAAPGPSRPPREFKLSWAVGASVFVHVVILLLSHWTPLFDRVEAAEPDEMTSLEFTFAPPTEDQDQPQENPRGDVPFETPPSPPLPPQELPEPTVDEAPGDAAATQPPEEAVAPQELTPPAPEPPSEPPPEPQQDDPSEGLPEPTEQPGTVAPDQPDSDFAPGAEVDPQETTPDQKRSLDLGSALSNFQRKIDRSREARPPTTAGSSGPQQNVFTPNDMGPLPVQGGPYGILEFSSRDYDWSDYARQIYWEILRAWYNRLYQTSADFEKWAYNNRSWMLDHSSGIKFVIERSGNVSGIELLMPAGCPPLDDSALDALSEVILPQLPADFPRDREVVRARFIATGDIRYLRQSLAQGKAAGRF